MSGYDFVNRDANPQDDFGHGTQVAGIAAASTNNLLGIAGVSWGAHVMPVKVLNSSGTGTYVNVAAGIHWATDNGAQVINLSLGGVSGSDTLKEAVDYAVSQGVTLVASAGNAYGGPVFYPAAYNRVLAVAAVDKSLGNASFSACGDQVDLAAPGVDIYSLQLGGGVRSGIGTSMSAPFVSGAAAILLGLEDNNAPSLVAQELKTTARDLAAPGWDSCTGYGLIQLDAAIRNALDRQEAADTPIPLSPAPPELWGSTTPSLTLTPTITGTLPTFTPTSISAFTLTPTLTEGGTAPTFTPTLSPAAGENSPTPEPAEVSAQSAAPGANPFSAPLPCLGAFFVLAGVAILVYAINLRRKSNY